MSCNLILYYIPCRRNNYTFCVASAIPHSTTTILDVIMTKACSPLKYQSASIKFVAIDNMESTWHGISKHNGAMLIVQVISE